jgi:2'-5' RNA ligase
MPFSIELFFDTKSDMAVQRLGQLLEKEKIPAIFSTLGATPHVSLAVFEQYDPQRLHSVMKKLACSFSPMPFRLSSLGTFPGKEGVLFLAPVVTPSLLEIHAWLHRALAKVVEGSWHYYFPGGWVPHCTLSVHLTAGKLAKGMELLRRKARSIQGQYNHLSLVETHPVHIKPIRLIYSVPLSGKNKA